MSFPLSSKIYQNAETIPPAATGWHVLAVLSLLMGFASISTDLYLPAMPEMRRSLHAGAGMVELTISGYLIGFSLGQLLWGPISERYGRRPSVAAGLVLFVIGSAGCALSGNMSTLIAWRVVQAIGACASVALSRAMVRDLYDGNRAARMLSTLITVMAVAPLIGPLVGGQIVALAGWRAIFWVLVGIGLVTLAALYFCGGQRHHGRSGRLSKQRWRRLRPDRRDTVRQRHCGLRTGGPSGRRHAPAHGVRDCGGRHRKFALHASAGTGNVPRPGVKPNPNNEYRTRNRKMSKGLRPVRRSG